MSARKRKPEVRWSKTQAQCPYCGWWMTRQGLNGHIRFKHMSDWAFEVACAELAKVGDPLFTLLSRRLDNLTEKERQAVLNRHWLLRRRRGEA